MGELKVADPAPLVPLVSMAKESVPPRTRPPAFRRLPQRLRCLTIWVYNLGFVTVFHGLRFWNHRKDFSFPLLGGKKSHKFINTTSVPTEQCILITELYALLANCAAAFSFHKKSRLVSSEKKTLKA